MARLSNAQIETLTSDSQALSTEQVTQLLEQIPNWRVETRSNDGLKYLVRKYQLTGYEQVLSYHSAIGNFAESVQHHPEMITEYGSLVVKWWSHSVGGLHKNDFICAAKCDGIIGQ